MEILELWRYPVKSMQGQRLSACTLEADGVLFDRAFGVHEVGRNTILTARREPRLLFAAAQVDEDGELVITLPGRERIEAGSPRDGRFPEAADAALSAWLGRPVELISAADTPEAVAESFADATDDDSTPTSWTLPAGRFVDSLPLLIVTTASLASAAEGHPEGQWDLRRFRPNLLVGCEDAPWAEDSWAGSTVRTGDTEIAVVRRCARCAIPTRAQPGLDSDVAVYTSLAARHRATFGVLARVAKPGTITVGEAVVVSG